jgi:DNA-binding transcriptional MerR regulator
VLINDQGSQSDDDLLTVCDVARLPERPVTTETVRSWANRGLLPSVRTPGGVRLFRRADAVHFVQRRSIAGKAGR